MAQGRACSQCGYHMYAIQEKAEKEGCYIIYKCRNTKCGMKESHFESYPPGFAEAVRKNPPKNKK
ncbi:hypothetical protein DD829_13930 [Chryseobacterium sp. HMWF035]|nr:hypothetical protein DBR25_05555 [Chryseobacterium sp. HMWF001]PVV55565.1 hypothetical protein DD829_13930 [Chryseobacterium sp. HMWF035]